MQLLILIAIIFYAENAHSASCAEPASPLIQSGSKSLSECSSSDYYILSSYEHRAFASSIGDGAMKASGFICADHIDVSGYFIDLPASYVNCKQGHVAISVGLYEQLNAAVPQEGGVYIPIVNTGGSSQEFIDAFVTFDAETFSYVVGVMLMGLALGMGTGWVIHVIRLAR